jgi:hypothetical protein
MPSCEAICVASSVYFYAASVVFFSRAPLHHFSSLLALVVVVFFIELDVTRAILFALFGYISGIVCVLCLGLPPIVGSKGRSQFSILLQFVIEWAIYQIIFLDVDDVIRETQFPIGFYLCFLKAMFLLIAVAYRREKKMRVVYAMELTLCIVMIVAHALIGKGMAIAASILTSVIFICGCAMAHVIIRAQ